MRDQEQLGVSWWKVVHAENAPGARTPPDIKHAFILLQHTESGVGAFFCFPEWCILIVLLSYFYHNNVVPTRVLCHWQNSSSHFLRC